MNSYFQLGNYFNPNSGAPENIQGQAGAANALLYVWQPSSLSFVALTADASGNLQVSSAGGGGGGAVTIADGANVTQGAIADAAVTSDTNGTLSAKLRGLVKILASVWDAVNGRLKVDGSGVTQPISAASLPLPTGAARDSSLATINTTLGTPFQAGGSIGNASFGISGTLPGFAATPTVNLGTIGTTATAANQTTGNTTLSSILTALGSPLQETGGSVSVANFPATQPVTGTFWQATQPISTASLPLPSNAAQESGGNLTFIGNTIDILRRIDATMNSILLVLQANSTISIGDRDDAFSADTTVN